MGEIKARLRNPKSKIRHRERYRGVEFIFIHKLFPQLGPSLDSKVDDNTNPPGRTSIQHLADTIVTNRNKFSLRAPVDFYTLFCNVKTEMEKPVAVAGSDSGHN